MFRGRRHRLPLVLASTCLILVSGAAAAPADNQFTALSTPSLVRPAPTSANYTITFSNDPAPSGEADRATIVPPAGFQVLEPPTGPGVTATVIGCGNTNPWEAAVLSGSTISLVRTGSSANNLCPGGSLVVVFSATTTAPDGTYAWGVELRRGDNPETDPPFILRQAELSVRVDGTPPNTAIDSDQSALTNSTSASFTFSSEPGATFECHLDGAPFETCTSPKSYTGLPEGFRTFTVHAVDPAGNSDPTPATRSWTIDVTPPNTTIGTRPPLLTGSTSASFTFSSEPGATFQCSLDGATFSLCSSPKSYTGLPGGTRTFAVRAIDTAANPDPFPATYSWTIDLSGPPTTIGSAPPSATNSTSASFSFSSEGGATFECSLDGDLFSACANPKGYDNLSDGPHAFAVRAIDSANNTGPASLHNWTIDTRPPAVSLSSAPVALSNSRSGAFGFSADEPSSFQCQLDGGGFQPCSSPATYQGLSDGTHTFVVQPTDAVGNAGPSSLYRWTIDATAPETRVTSAPRSATTTVSATFRFAANEPVSFQCKLDAAAFAPCTSPKSYARLRRSRHTFAVRAVDAAGNIDATPAAHRWTIGTAAPRTLKKSSALFGPLPGARVTSPPLLRWRPVARASYYNVQLYRGRVKMLSAWPTRPSLRLRSGWTYLGRQRKLAPGAYRWYVWPAYRHNRYGRLLGQSTFVVKAK